MSEELDKAVDKAKDVAIAMIATHFTSALDKATEELPLLLKGLIDIDGCVVGLRAQVLAYLTMCKLMGQNPREVLDWCEGHFKEMLDGIQKVSPEELAKQTHSDGWRDDKPAGPAPAD